MEVKGGGMTQKKDSEKAYIANVVVGVAPLLGGFTHMVRISYAKCTYFQNIKL